MAMFLRMKRFVTLEKIIDIMVEYYGKLKKNEKKVINYLFLFF